MRVFIILYLSFHFTYQATGYISSCAEQAKLDPAILERLTNEPRQAYSKMRAALEEACGQFPLPDLYINDLIDSCLGLHPFVDIISLPNSLLSASCTNLSENIGLRRRQLYVLAGQSNAEGQVTTSALMNIAQKLPPKTQPITDDKEEELTNAILRGLGQWCTVSTDPIALNIQKSKAHTVGKLLHQSNVDIHPINPQWRHDSALILPYSFKWVLPYTESTTYLPEVTAPLTVNFGALSDGKNKYGPEIGFGIRFAKSFGDLLILKIVMGGSSLGEHWRPDGQLFQTLVQKSLEVAKDQNAALAGFIWFQGWNDQYNSEGTPRYPKGTPLWQHYETNLSRLIKDYRNAIGRNMSIIIGHSLSSNAALKTIRAAKASVVQKTKFAGLVETDDLSTCHNYDAGAQIIIGERMAETALTLQAAMRR